MYTAFATTNKSTVNSAYKRTVSPTNKATNSSALK
jgi:hypothetical protein